MKKLYTSSTDALLMATAISITHRKTNAINPFKLLKYFLVLAPGLLFHFTGFTQSLKWHVFFTYASSKLSSDATASLEENDKRELTGQGSFVVYSALPDRNGGFVINTGEEDSVGESNVSANFTEDMSEISKDAGEITAKTIRHHYGKAEKEDLPSIEFQYQPLDNLLGLAGLRLSLTVKGKDEFWVRDIDKNILVKQPDYNLDEINGTGILMGSHKDSIKKIKNGYIINYKEEVDTSYTDHLSGRKTTLRTSRTYRVVLLKEINLEAFIEPKDAGYKQWLPLGPDLANPSNLGNSIDFTVYVKDKTKPAQKITDLITSVDYTLDPSHEPGWAMNFPAENACLKADLQLCAKDQPADTAKEKLNLTLKGDQDPSWTATVHSFDYGAYGKLSAIVTLSTGDVLIAKWAEINKPFILIPYRKKEDSRISDYWKQQNNATGLNDNEDTDKEKDLGDGHLGDGLTVYEEYRGFIENKKHIRTNPNKLDLMVGDMIGGRSKDGVDLFKTVTGINVHSDFRLEEFGRLCDTSEGLPRDKCVNFNFSPLTHEVDQHGIAIVQNLEKRGYALAVLKNGIPGIGTPRRYKYLEITSDFDPGPDGYLAINGRLDAAGNFITDPEGPAKLISDNYAATVAHEMLHCCNVKHHGDLDVWQALLVKGQFVNGGDPTKLYYKSPSNFQQIDVFWDDGSSTPFTVKDLPDSVQGKFLFVGYEGGQHSGVEDCIMRYNSADAYYKDYKLYIIKVKSGYSTEATGMSLCSSKTGTGINAPGRKPRPRYGNATNGDCRHQFCINDKYH